MKIPAEPKEIISDEAFPEQLSIIYSVSYVSEVMAHIEKIRAGEETGEYFMEGGARDSSE